MSRRELSWLVPVANATAPNTMDIRNSTLAHVAADYEAVLYLLIPNGTADNTQTLQLYKPPDRYELVGINSEEHLVRIWNSMVLVLT